MHNINLYETWHDLASGFTDDNSIIRGMFRVIEKYYSENHRFYHTLQHIKTMIATAWYYFDSTGKSVPDIEAFWFALWYHDIIYDPKHPDNELRSALFAQKALKSLQVNNKVTRQVYQLILATSHAKPDKTKKISMDTQNLLLDCDLIVLGSSRKSYKQYAQAIRKEYRFVPQKTYSKKRAEILTGFLQRDTIYTTGFFENKFGKQARENLKYELQQLINNSSDATKSSDELFVDV